MKCDLELLFLQDAFQNIAFFEKMKKELEPEDLLLLLRQLKIESYEAGQALFNYGEYFIVLL